MCVCIYIYIYIVMALAEAGDIRLPPTHLPIENRVLFSLTLQRPNSINDF